MTQPAQESSEGPVDLPMDDGKPETEADATSTSTTRDVADSYTVVLRSSSAARFRPEEGQLLTVSGLPGIEGRMQIRIRTRWQELGHDAPVPRELWVEVRCRATALDVAISVSSSVARVLTSLIAFTANVRCGVPEVHLAYDSTPGHSERDFVEVFLPDEQGLPNEGRLINPAELTAVYESFKRLVRIRYGWMSVRRSNRLVGTTSQHAMLCSTRLSALSPSLRRSASPLERPACRRSRH